MAKVIWLTGISGSGKTTLGLKLKERFSRQDKRVELLDGDIVRSFFEGDLGYTKSERMLNVRRIAFAAMLLAKNGIDVIVANIAPYYEVRDFIRKNIKDYIQIYLEVSKEEAVRRDVKGHYKKYRDGEIENFVGLDDRYDIPRNPDLILNTEVETADESLDRIMDYLKTHGKDKSYARV